MMLILSLSSLAGAERAEIVGATTPFEPTANTGARVSKQDIKNKAKTMVLMALVAQNTIDTCRVSQFNFICFR